MYSWWVCLLQPKDETNDTTKFDWILLSVALTGQYGLFNMAHFFLAVKYQAIAKHVPAKIDGREQEEETTCDVATYWALVASNILSVSLRGISFAFLYIDYNVTNTEPSPLLKSLKVVSTFWMVICQIISGIMLVKGVNTIREFF